MSFISTLKKPLVKIDRFLLENHPLLWETQLHWMFYYVVITHVVVGAFVLLLHVNPETTEFISTAYGLSFIPIVIALGAWQTVVVRFNLSNENGSVKKLNEVPKFFALMLSLALLFSVSYTIPLTLSYNAVQATDLKQLKEEIDILNEGAPYFVEQVGYYEGYYESYRNGDSCVVSEFYKHKYFSGLSEEQEKMLGIKNANELEESYANTNEKSVKDKISKYLTISAKYGNPIELSADSIYALHKRKCSLYMRDSEGNYQYMGPSLMGPRSYDVSQHFNNLVDIVTYNFFFMKTEGLWVYFILIIAVSLVVNILKSFRWQSFILLPIFFVPFTIISIVLILLLTSGSDEEDYVMTYFLIVYILIFFIGVRGAYKAAYSWFSAICLMMAQLGLTALPTFILWYCREMGVLIPGIEVQYSDYSYEYYSVQEGATQIYFWIGFGLLIFTLPLFRALQIKYTSLPRVK